MAKSLDIFNGVVGIRRVANGWVVTPGKGQYEPVAASDTYVFNEWEEVAAFLNHPDTLALD